MKSSRLLLSALLFAGYAFGAATILIENNDGAGEGFNDPTPAAPVGGNPGITLGQQRLNAFQHAAIIWGATLTSSVPVRVRANFDPLTCTATSAVLGSAGPVSVFRDFTGAPKTGTWYHVALASKLFGADLDGTGPDLAARFNSNLGQPDCLDGSPFYLGLDNNHGALIDLVTVLLHEFGHGLGFSNMTSGSTGALLAGFPSMWDHFLLDNTTNKTWLQMTDAERAASAINPRKLVWTGPNSVAGAAVALSPGTPLLKVAGPAAGPAAGDYSVGTATFGPPLASPGVTAQIMPLTGSGNQVLGCDPLNATNALAVLNKIALIDRGICSFTIKVKNAQNAGAVGVIIADNAAGGPPSGLGGSDATITIPTVRITLADGIALKARLVTRSRTGSGLIGTLGIDLAVRSGADAAGRPLMYTPNPFQGGSSVSHWDTIAFPNQLMEPAINGDLFHSVVLPFDLTFSLFKDLGWN